LIKTAIRKAAMTATVVSGVIGLTAGTAFAHECVNASKPNQAAGAQVILDSNGNIVDATRGVANRVEKGLIDPDTGEGFHGVMAFDFDDDGVADVGTFIVGPEDEIPLQAQNNGPSCRGITNIEVYFTECVA
jgi:hypothetical protein